MRIVVTGGRDFTDKDFIFSSLDSTNAESPISLLIEGGQRTYDRNLGKCVGGADFFAYLWAIERSIPCATVHAHWKRFDKAAGMIRNGWMINLFHIDKVIAFSGSRGTANCIAQAEKAGIEVIRFTPPSHPDLPK